MVVDATTTNSYGKNLFIFTEDSFNLKADSLISVEYSSDQCEYVEIRLVKKSDITNEENSVKEKIFEKLKTKAVPESQPEKLETENYTPLPIIMSYTEYNSKDNYIIQQIDMRDLTKPDEYYIVLGFHLDFRKKKLFRIKVYSQAEAVEVAE